MPPSDKFRAFKCFIRTSLVISSIVVKPSSETLLGSSLSLLKLVLVDFPELPDDAIVISASVTSTSFCVLTTSFSATAVVTIFGA